MDWWVWLVTVVSVCAAGAGALAGVQARRRSGGVVVVRRARLDGEDRSA